jgi:hypothetical protein
MSLTIKKLKDPLTVDHVKMSCDKPMHVSPPLPDTPFFWLVVGAPGSGKTNLLVNLINKVGKFYHKQFERVYFTSPSTHTIAEKLGVHPDNLFSDVSRLQEILDINGEYKRICPHHRALFVFDDMSHILKKLNNQDFLCMIQNRRHYGAHILFVAQKLNKIPLEMRTLASHIAMFNTPHNTEWKVLDDEFNFTSSSYSSMRRHIYRDPHDFLFLDLNGQKMYRNFSEIISVKDKTDEPIEE